MGLSRQCPVFSNDSDFFVFNVDFVKLDSLDMERSKVEGNSSWFYSENICVYDALCKLSNFIFKKVDRMCKKNNMYDFHFKI